MICPGDSLDHHGLISMRCRTDSLQHLVCKEVLICQAFSHQRDPLRSSMVFRVECHSTISLCQARFLPPPTPVLCQVPLKMPPLNLEGCHQLLSTTTHPLHQGMIPQERKLMISHAKVLPRGRNLHHPPTSAPSSSGRTASGSCSTSNATSRNQVFTTSQEKYSQ